MEFTLNKNAKTPRNIIGSKCEIKKNTNYSRGHSLGIGACTKRFLGLENL